MAQKRYSSPKYDQFFYRGDNLSENRKKWNEEMKRLLNRAGDWARKFHAVADIPTKPDRVYAKDIERLKEMVWKNIDEPTRKQYRKEYEYRYENKMPEIYTPKLPYKPPTEKEFLNNNVPGIPQPSPQPSEESDEEPDEDGYTETVDSRAEIEAWIRLYIDPIDLDLIGTNLVEKDGARDTIERLILEAADAYGDYTAYHSYLEEKAGVIVDLATKALMAYIGYKGRTYDSFPEAMPELATVLNLGRPLTPSQSERLQDEGWVSYDFND